MNDQATKIQVVINTLQAMEIKATFDNMNHMMAVLKILAEVRDAIAAPNEVTLEVVKDGKADTE